jgi:hypothetical protein
VHSHQEQDYSTKIESIPQHQDYSTRSEKSANKKNTTGETTLTRTMPLMPLRDPHIKQTLRPMLRQGSEVHEPEAGEGAVVGAADVAAVGFAASVWGEGRE